MLFVRSFVRVTAVLAAKRAARPCCPRIGQNAGRTARPRTTDRARPTAHDHARTRTTTNDRPRTHDRARPRTTARARPTAHDHALPRTTTHDRPRTHDRARPRTTDHGCHICLRKRYPPHPRGFRGLNCLARLALARERTPSFSNANLRTF